MFHLQSSVKWRFLVFFYALHSFIFLFFISFLSTVFPHYQDGNCIFPWLKTISDFLNLSVFPAGMILYNFYRPFSVSFSVDIYSCNSFLSALFYSGLVLLIMVAGLVVSYIIARKIVSLPPKTQRMLFYIALIPVIWAIIIITFILAGQWFYTRHGF